MGKKDETPEERATRKEKEKKGATRERNARRSARRRRQARVSDRTEDRAARPRGRHPTFTHSTRRRAADADAPSTIPSRSYLQRRRRRRRRRTSPTRPPRSAPRGKPRRRRRRRRRLPPDAPKKREPPRRAPPVLKGGKAPATGYMDDMDLPSSGSEDETEDCAARGEGDYPRR